MNEHLIGFKNFLLRDDERLSRPECVSCQRGILEQISSFDPRDYKPIYKHVSKKGGAHVVFNPAITHVP